MTTASYETEWAQKVHQSYKQQVADGIEPPLLPEALLWATPGNDCFKRLAELGLKTTVQRWGVILEPTDTDS